MLIILQNCVVIKRKAISTFSNKLQSPKIY